MVPGMPNSFKRFKMNKLILIVFTLLLFSCKKDKATTVPQSLIDEFSQECNSECKPQLHRVELNGVDYIGVYWAPTGCDSLRLRRYFHKELGTEIFLFEPRYSELNRGRVAEVLWSCN